MKCSEKQPGEIEFERYLRALSISWSYEPDIEGVHPDYLLFGKSEIVCEVKDFESSALEQSVIPSILNGESVAGPWNPVDYIRARLKKARKQLQSSKGIRPGVVVLFNTQTMPFDDSLFIEEALFGAPVFSESVGPSGASSTSLDSGNSETDRFLTVTSNTSISAVAVLEVIRPNIHLLETAQNEVLSGINEGRVEGEQKNIKADVRRALPLLERAQHEIESKYGKPYLYTELARLRVFHNLFAALPLEQTVFNAEFDEHFFYHRDNAGLINRCYE